METAENSVYCRLCAEASVHVFMLINNRKKCNEIMSKLSFLNIDITISDLDCCCIACYDSLNKAHDFLYKVKKAQSLYWNPCKHTPVDNDISNVNIAQTISHIEDKNQLVCPTFEEILAAQSNIPIGQPVPDLTPQPGFLNSNVELARYPNAEATVKVKLEATSTDTDIDSDRLQDYDIQNINQGDSLSVQDILDAALNTSPFNNDEDEIEIYAKEVPILPKKKPKVKQHKTKVKQHKTKVKRHKTEQKALSKELRVNKTKSPKSYGKNKHKPIEIEIEKCNSVSVLEIPKSDEGTSKTLIKSDVTWSSYPWICAYCKIEFHSVDMLREHAKMVHGKCGAFTCVDCAMSGFTLCPKDFHSFVKHVRMHRAELRERCQYCDCVIKRQCQAHIAQHFPPPALPCLSCGEPLPDDEALEQHVQSYMPEPRKKRRKPNTPITEADLTCKVCNNVYKTLNSLRDHMKSQHKTGRTRDFTCERCGKMFYSKGTLTSHILKHEGKKPHACKICSKTFLFPNLLRRHVESHSGIKPYQCASCPKRFRLRQQLANHSVVHSDHLPFRCQYCSKAFRFKSIVQNHERQHTGAKPYECRHCGMQFTCWSNYNKHMKRRHNTDTSKKKITAQGMLPVDPTTGQVIQPVTGLEEWKTQIMLPVKRGKKPKPVVKTERESGKENCD